MRLVRVIAITILWLASAGALEAATLQWDRNPEPNVGGYRLSYGTQPGVHTTSVDVGNVLSYNLTPPAGQRYYIVIQALAGSMVSEKSNEVVLDLTAPTNQPPTLNQPPNQSGYVGNTATLTLSGSDPENGTLTYSAAGLPAGLTLNASAGVISGTLQTAASYNVTATVSDGAQSASRSFTWIVATLSAPTPSDTTAPTVSFISPLNNETLNGKNAKLRINASDAGGVRSVQYLLDGTALSGALTAAPFNYTWDISRVSAGLHQLTARAVDNAGNVGAVTLTVTVRPGGSGKNSVLSATAETDADAPAPGDTSANKFEPASRDTPEVAVTGDFDGDGIVDPGAFMSSTGEWRLWLSSTRYGQTPALVWGAENDVPVPADYDGDGRTDLAIFRPSSGTWSIVASNNGTPSRLDVPFGRPGDSPIAFDYDRDGRADLALKRPGGFDILLSSTNYLTRVTVR